MKHTTLKITGLALAIAAAAFTARADVALNENVSLYGYAAASFQFNKPNTGNTNTTMDLDAAKLGFAFNFAPVTAKVSFYAKDGDLFLLEANATYDIAAVKGLSVTAGRFQSWLGYEAFDIPNCTFITYGTDVFGFIIPNFHEGVKAEFKVDKMDFGLAVVNSVASVPFEYRGEGRLNNGYGVEARFGFKDGDFSLAATLAYQNSRGNSWFSDVLNKNTYVADVWAQYVLNSKTTFGAELYYLQSNTCQFHGGGSHHNFGIFYGLVMAKHQFNDKFSLAGRVSAGQDKWKAFSDKANFMKLSVQPAYALTKNLGVGAELSYTKYNKTARLDYGVPKDNVFLGVQAVFKF